MHKIIALSAFILTFALIGMIGKVTAANDALVLARVVYPNFESIKDLSVYAILQDDRGNDYALVLARLSQLEKCKADYEILDRQAAGASAYWLVRARRSTAQPPAFGRWLYYDGRIGVIRIDGPANSITQVWKSAGYELLPLPDEPLILNRAQTSPLGINVYNSEIADMISQVNSAAVYTLTGQLTGDWPASIGGSPYTFTTRNTKNSAAIQNATQFAYEYMQTRNLSPVYQNWSGCPNSNPTSSRNVIGEIPGNMLANQVVLVTAHIDDMPSSGSAPGADDNASGVVGVLVAADILKQYQFERTVRFVIFTGEEQGLCGSKAYANLVSDNEENVVAVFNMDMVAWDGSGGPVIGLHTRNDGHPSYADDLGIASAFIGVVDDYGLDSVLSPEVVDDGELYSDHSSFWNKGFPALLVIEDYDDFTPYYHTQNDKLATLNQTYYNNVIRAIVGTSATLAVPHQDNHVYIPVVLSVSQ